MPATTVGRNALAGLMIGEGNVFNNANARIGVGDGTSSFGAGQTDLQGSNTFRKVMMASFPNRNEGDNILRFRSSFSTSEANFAWQEWGVFNAASGGTMFNRRVVSLGTKTSAQTWEFTVDLTITLV